MGTCLFWQDADTDMYLSPWDGEPEWERAVAASRDAVRLRGAEAEAAGIVWRTADGTTRITVFRNIAERPGTFEFSSQDCFTVYELLATGSLLSIWHSHPLGHREPSRLDWDNHPHGVPMVIVSLENDKEAMVLRYDDSERPASATANQ